MYFGLVVSDFVIACVCVWRLTGLLFDGEPAGFVLI